MKRFNLHFLLTCFLVFFAFGSMAQFSGVITLEEEQRGRKVTKKIYVKGDLVKVETYMPNGELKGTKIINTADETVTALIPARNLYFEVPHGSVDREVDAEIKKTGNTETIAGEEAHQVIVVNKDNKTAVAFWMAKNDYDFYAPMMAALSKNNAVANHFRSLEEKGGIMPMRVVVRKADGQVMSKTEVVSIDREAVIDDSEFEIPEGYSLMER